MQKIVSMVQEIDIAITNGNDDLSDILFDLNLELMMFDEFPSDVFNKFLDLFGRAEFQRAKGSWQVIKVFEENGKILTHEQRSSLVSLFCNVYEKFEDATSCFLIAELLVDLSDGEGILQSFRSLAKTPKEIPKAMLSRGILRLVSKSNSENIKVQAIGLLKDLSQSKSEVVQQEVSYALKQLTN